MLCSYIKFELTDKLDRGKKKLFEVFELSEFELSGVNYYKKYCPIQGELDLVRVNEEFELREFELAGDYCMSDSSSPKTPDILSDASLPDILRDALITLMRLETL